MRILSYYARPTTYSSGGVNESISGWLDAMARNGHDVTFAAPTHGFALPASDYGGAGLTRIDHWGRRRPTMLPRRSGRLVSEFDLVYLHEGWTASNLVVAAACRRAGVPYAVMPHGVYDPQIVATLRRAPGRHHAEGRMLHGAAVVHLFYDTEIAGVRRLAPRARVAAARTGFREPPVLWSPQTSAEPYWSWLGRFDPHHKGIDILLAAWAMMPAEERPLLRMVGPDYRGGRARTEQIVAQSGLERWVRIEDPIERAETAGFVAASQGFIHVPRWEALGRTVVDAALLGAPVVVSRTAHIAGELPARNAHVVSLDPAAIADAVRGAAHRFGTAETAARAAAARKLFGWEGSIATWNTRVLPMIPLQETPR